MNVKSRIHRILKDLEHYRDFTSMSVLPYDISQSPIKAEDICYGAYENFIGTLQNIIIITNNGIYLNQNGAWEFVEYKQIISINTPKKIQNDGKFSVTLLNNKEIEIEVLGKKGKYLDVFEFIRFLYRVVEDFQKLNAYA